MSAMTQSFLDGVLGRVRDVDSHEMFPAHLWTEEFGEQFAPLAEFFIANQSQTVPNSFAVRQIADDTPITKEALPSFWSAACLAPGAYDTERRLQFMAVAGIHDALVFGSMMGFIGSQFAVSGGKNMERFVGSKLPFEPVSMGRAMVKAHNDWCVRVAKRTSRLRPVACILTVSLKDAIAESERVVGEGVRAVNIAAGSPIEDRAPAHPDNDLLWRFFAERNIPVLLHIGSEKTFLTDQAAWTNAPQFATNTSLPSELSTDPLTLATCNFGAQNYLTNLVLGGVFERVPDLRVGLMELTGYWIGPAAENMDIWADQFAGRMRGILSARPSEYVRRNVRCSPFAFEPVDQYIERFSFLQDVYCFSSDYPPYEGGKDPIGAVAKKIGRLGPDVFEKFFVSNAEWVMPN